jgi:hypothetical protein
MSRENGSAERRVEVLQQRTKKSYRWSPPRKAPSERLGKKSTTGRIGSLIKIPRLFTRSGMMQGRQWYTLSTNLSCLAARVVRIGAGIQLQPSSCSLRPVSPSLRSCCLTSFSFFTSAVPDPASRPLLFAIAAPHPDVVVSSPTAAVVDPLRHATASPDTLPWTITAKVLLSEHFCYSALSSRCRSLCQL